MKVFDLRCGAHHQFEGWFASEGDYASQIAGGMLVCPMCGDAGVHKLPSAPRLNLGAAESLTLPPAQAVTGEGTGEGARQNVATGLDVQALQAAWLHAARRIVAETEDVGARFAEEARKIHYGESEERGIRGQATLEETRELMDEGIAVLPLPLPDGLKGPLQ